ncbi:MAG: histidine kinase [Flavobacteriaceae bacterium]|nr:histidine kinase [Flavobacteriaceae bacterium]
MKKTIFIIIVFINLSVFGQEIRTQKSEIVKDNTIYTSVIREDTGKPLSGVTVRVRGTGETARTNFNGEFTVHAKSGDVLIISKDGKRINTITLNNSNFYKIDDKSKIEQKKSNYKSKISKKIRVPSANKLLDSARLYQKTNPDKCINFVEKALKKLGSRGNKNEISQAYTILGDTYFHIKQYDLAVTNYEISLNFKNENFIKFKLAKAYTLNNNFTESTEMYNELLKEKISTNQKIVVYEGLGDNASKKLDKLDKAIEHYNKGLEIAKRNKITPKISELNSKIGETYSQKGENQQAEDYFENTLELSEADDVKSRARSKNSIANYYKEQKKYDKEIELRKETLEELESVSDDEIVFDDVESEVTSQKLNLDIGNAYFNKGDLIEAIPYLEKSIEKANLVDDFETQKDALQRLSELYRSAGKSEKALEKYQEYAQLVDVIYKQKEGEIQDAIALGKELTNKQNRINSLEKDRELSESRYSLFSSQKQLTQENYRRQRLIIYSLLGGLLLLLFSVFWMYKSNKQKRLANNLLALKSLRSQMNPHFIFNALNSVNNYISQNDERAANRYLTEFSTLMRSVLDNSEQDFIPLEKEIELLELYMKLEHSRFTDKFDYKLIVDKKLQISEFQIPPMLLQPYVENAVWHGLRYKKEKGKLEVKISQKDYETVEISIIDDGIGRKKSKELKTDNQIKQQSKGMNNIKKRIAILNEMYTDKVDVFIDDLHSDNSGTKVVLTLKKD